MITLYTTVWATDLPRILANGFTERDEVDEPANPHVGIILSDTPEPWESDGPPAWVTIAVILDTSVEKLGQYTVPDEIYWWIPAHRLHDALIRQLC